ncbi:TPA: cell division protein ZapA [Haemophilus influenzae]
MSLKLVEILVLGQVLRLNVPIEQEELLRQAARNLDILVSEMKEKTGLIQLDRVLSIVALNLSFELSQEKNKTAQIENVLRTRIQQLDHSLENIRVTKEPH